MLPQEGVSNYITVPNLGDNFGKVSSLLQVFLYIFYAGTYFFSVKSEGLNCQIRVKEGSKGHLR